MKKLFTFLTVFVFFLIPFSVFAAVNISLADTSTEDTNTISINIDTETDVLEQVMLPIRFSEGVTITDVTQGTIECPTLEYSDSLENTIIINCELEEATALDGTLATILFTSTEEGLYTFEVLEDDENLDIGTLALGEVVNIGQTEQLETTDDPLDESTFEDTETDDTIPFEDDTLVTTQDGMPIETEDSFSFDDITEYLPYILIGASVILLISIIAILLGKKKGPKTPKKSKETPPKRTTPKPPTTQNETSQEEPTLKSMVNSVENTAKQPPTQTPPEQPTPQSTPEQPQPPVAQQTTPPQQPTPSTPPISQPSQPQPPSQRTSSPQISPKTQEEDLQEILKREAQLTQSTQSNPEQNIDSTTPQPQPPQTPPENKETYMQENPTLKKPDQELQENINREINQIKRTSPPAEAPGVIPPDQDPPTTDLNTGSLPSQPTTSNEYPPVPPSAQQPNQQGNQQNTQQQGPPVAQTPEELPETPPTM